VTYPPAVNVFHLLADTARAHPDQPALRQDGTTATYGEALRAALALARALAERGIRPGDRVAVLAPNTVAHFHAYFGLAAAGAVLVSLNTRLGAGELAEILADSGARMLVHDDAHGSTNAAMAAELAPRLELGAHPVAALVAAAAGSAEFGPRLARSEDTAHLYYTSGTTGRPKGVMLSHANVFSHARSAVRELGLGASDRWLHAAPMFHLADAWATFAVSDVGGLHVFLPRFSARDALDILAAERITVTNLIPTMLNLMVKEPGALDRDYAMRVMLSGGAPIAPEVVRQVIRTFRCEYVQTYGMTETSPYLTLSLLDDELRRLPPEQQLALKCRTGRPFDGIELRVVDDRGEDVARDDRAVGEIRVKGPTVTRGYWNQPEATAAAFDERGFLMTGDLATVDAHGFVNIVDRKKDVIKTGGEAVYSVEVEHVLYQHPAVLECAVYGTPHEVWGEAVTAAVVLRPGAHASADQLVAHCHAHIAGYKCPKSVRFLDALPRTGTGKIQKRALRQPGPAR